MSEFQPSKHDMARGLSQVLFNYLPGKTFDMVGGTNIAQVTRINGRQVKDLQDTNKLFKELKKYIKKWDENQSGFRSELEEYIFEKPEAIKFDIFPLTYRCPQCKRVYHYKDYRILSKTNENLICLHGDECQGKKLKQLYQVAVHECGEITGLYPLKPEKCDCKDWRNHITFDERKSQKVSDFRWICKKCKFEREVKYFCSSCDLKYKEMSISPHRSSKNYYTHFVRCVDVASNNYKGSWEDDVRRYLKMENFTKNDPTLEKLRKKIEAMKLTEEEKLDLLKEIDEDVRGDVDFSLIDEEVCHSLHEYLETENPAVMTSYNIGKVADLLQDSYPAQRMLLLKNAQMFKEIGINDLILIEDFPVVTAVFGFTRGIQGPTGEKEKNTNLVSFRYWSDEPGKIPVYVDNGKCEAIMFRLDPIAVIKWIREQGIAVEEENCIDEGKARYWLLCNMRVINPQEESNEHTVSYLIYNLIHSMSHEVMRAMAGISGYELIGLSEYLFPAALSFVIYSNRTDFSIGGMHTLFETQLDVLYQKMFSSELRICMYDPLCNEKEGACHACLYLPEIACSSFNKMLSRHYLYGGTGVRGYWEGKY
ncbi:hypothetical protein C8Z91_33010 [Paenibacillus elgii]|uniref:DUF1998 domain-containing protein n=1 Tax=Paenibacillus elgii TaxID=189691 RepID=A0A2T6FS22_9BACL|nr:hypothetical protein [Paenibacillus elgii]PUA34702.1 hypothetical protein C8Z91_33010 [Paenibacillus elgii]